MYRQPSLFAVAAVFVKLEIMEKSIKFSLFVCLLVQFWWSNNILAILFLTLSAVWSLIKVIDLEYGDLEPRKQGSQISLCVWGGCWGCGRGEWWGGGHDYRICAMSSEILDPRFQDSVLEVKPKCLDTQTSHFVIHYLNKFYPNKFSYPHLPLCSDTKVPRYLKFDSFCQNSETETPSLVIR